jgi:hypothetical protein
LKRYGKHFVAAAAALVGAGAIIATIPAAFAQGGPPPIPGTFYGDISGGPAVGDPVVAFVVSPSGTNFCGTTTVITNPASGTPVYALDVFAEDTSHPGCGADGRTVRFYFPKTHQFASQSGVWHQGLSGQLNLTGASALLERNFVPNAANDAPRP